MAAIMDCISLICSCKFCRRRSKASAWYSGDVLLGFCPLTAAAFIMKTATRAKNFLAHDAGTSETIVHLLDKTCEGFDS
jgi:hypothetical protein